MSEMMYIFAFIFGMICGAFCMGIASASKDEPIISEEDEKELLGYINEKARKDLQDL